MQQCSHFSDSPVSGATAGLRRSCRARSGPSVLGATASASASINPSSKGTASRMSCFHWAKARTGAPPAPGLDQRVRRQTPPARNGVARLPPKHVGDGRGRDGHPTLSPGSPASVPARRSVRKRCAPAGRCRTPHRTQQTPGGTSLQKAARMDIPRHPPAQKRFEAERTGRRFSRAEECAASRTRRRTRGPSSSGQTLRWPGTDAPDGQAVSRRVSRVTTPVQPRGHADATHPLVQVRGHWARNASSTNASFNISSQCATAGRAPTQACAIGASRLAVHQRAGSIGNSPAEKVCGGVLIVNFEQHD